MDFDRILDGLFSLVGNGKIFGDTVQDHSTSSHRRVERIVQLTAAAEVDTTIGRLKVALAGVPNVLRDPPPRVEIDGYNDHGPVLAVQPNAHPEHYWQGYYATSRAIADTVGATGRPLPEERRRG